MERQCHNSDSGRCVTEEETRTQEQIYKGFTEVCFMIVRPLCHSGNERSPLKYSAVHTNFAAKCYGNIYDHIVTPVLTLSIVFLISMPSGALH